MTEEHVQSRTASSARLRFVLGDQAIDIAVPAEVPLIDLLPAVLLQFGAEVIERGAEHEGWVLQRLGSESLDDDLTARELDLHDGEQLFLRPRGEQLAPIDYDDIVSGVAEQVRTQSGRWTPRRTRTMLLAAGTASLLAGVAVLAVSGTGLIAAGLAGVVALIALAAAGTTARGRGDTVTATAQAGIAAVHAAASGALGVATTTNPSLPVVVTAAGAATVVALAVGLVVVADAALLFTGALVFATSVALAGLVAALAHLTLAQGAAGVLAATVVAGLFVPAAAFRLSGLTLPLLPSAPEELTEEITPVSHRLVVEQGQVMVGYSAALHAGFGAAQTVLIVATITGGTWGALYGVVAALLLMLRSRHPSGVVPRWSYLVPAAIALALVPVGLGQVLAPVARLGAVWLPTVAVGILLLHLADVMPGRRLRPYWGRAVDILESLTAVALLPLLLLVLGVFGFVRGLGS